MTSKRPAILMGILLAMVLGYLSRPLWEPRLFGSTKLGQVQEPPLPGENALTGLEVQRDSKGQWTASFDYYFTGAPLGAYLTVQLRPSVAATSNPTSGRATTYVPGRVERGKHHVTVEIQHPGDESTNTKEVAVLLMSRTGPTASQHASQQIQQSIEWPSWQTWARDRELAMKTTDELFKRAVSLIDSGGLKEAKVILERLIGRDKHFDAGYVELARIAMKSNWGPEGLHQAEGYLSSALQIDPNSVNAKILLGYVYTHQGRYAQAESLFESIAPTDPKNLWLWSNWGELLAMRGKLELAALKYREALARPRTLDTYDKARLDAYDHLLALLERRKDFDGMDALHRQRVDEYGAGSCYSAEYAEFVLDQRGDAAAAISLAHQAVTANCDTADARHTLGLGHYVAWANATGQQRIEEMNQARIYLPTGPLPLYLLASHDRTMGAAKELLTAGEKIDQTDNNKFNALAYALERKDIATARRLIRLGARTDTPVGAAGIPVAFMPVMALDPESIKLMQQSGVDYSKIRYQGLTAVDIAKRSGNSQLLQLIEHKSSTL
jgi:tetratricopeptide (TPR) repeat protein